MKLEDYLLFAMSSSGNENSNFLMINSSRKKSIELVNRREKSNTLCPTDSHVTESDEGFCIYNPNPKSIHNKSNCNISRISLTVTGTLLPETMRRARSTPNLLQIPSTQRSRKRSDDSAVGSAEESELSDKLSDVSTDECKSTGVYSVSRRNAPGLDEYQEEVMVPTLGVTGQILRPPSVVVSDHDLCPDGAFVTLDEIDAEYNESARMRRRISDCSTCSSISFSEIEYSLNTFQQDEEETGIKKISRWKTVKHIFHQLTPFILTYKNSRYPWVQLAGHQGNFKPGEQQGTILKKYCEKEKIAFEQLMEDSLKPFVPQYYKIVQDDTDNVQYIQLEDLLGQFENPCVMDCKLGVRTYLEEELLKAKEKPKLRKDMYEKMCQIDPTAPTVEEHQLHGVTKPRYMVWRETISTTSTFGFRIEGVRRSDGFSSKDYKTTRTEAQVREAFAKFVNGFPHVTSLYVKRLQELQTVLTQSRFFVSHEIIGSSLLFVHDGSKASAWMIDFAKTCQIPEDVPPITHDRHWSVGNHEDGYLIGLSNLIKVFNDLSEEEKS